MLGQPTACLWCCLELPSMYYVLPYCAQVTNFLRRASRARLRLGYAAPANLAIHVVVTVAWERSKSKSRCASQTHLQQLAQSQSCLCYCSLFSDNGGAVAQAPEKKTKF